MRRALLLILVLTSLPVAAQKQLPDTSFLATFGNMSGTDCVDNDFSQTAFFVVPEKYTGEIYLRVFDPDCGGGYDIKNGLWETNTIFEVFGGEGCVSAPDARLVSPSGNYKSGVLLDKALFACESSLDENYYSFGPYTAQQGERLAEYPGYLFFKVIVEGRTGDDTNVYALFVSSSANYNQEIASSKMFGYAQTSLFDGVIDVTTSSIDALSNNEVPIPVLLDPVKPETEFEISVEPLDE